MIDLYISEELYNETIQERSGDLYYLLHNRAVQVYLDVDEEDLILNDDPSIPSDDRSYDLNAPRSGKRMLDCLKQGKEIKEGLSKVIHR